MSAGLCFGGAGGESFEVFYCSHSRKMQEPLDLCLVAASADPCLRGHKAPPLYACSLGVSYKDIVAGFRVHWLTQDHILILPSLTIISQSPFITIRQHSCVVGIRRECLQARRLGAGEAGSKADFLESVTETLRIFVRFYSSSHYILFLTGDCWYRGMVSVIYPAIC